MTTDETSAKALVAFAAAVGEACGTELSCAIADFLVGFADNPACDRATSELLWNLITVIEPPQYTPRGMLGEAFA